MDDVRGFYLLPRAVELAKACLICCSSDAWSWVRGAWAGVARGVGITATAKVAFSNTNIVEFS